MQPIHTRVPLRALLWRPVSGKKEFASRRFCHAFDSMPVQGGSRTEKRISLAEDLPYRTVIQTFWFCSGTTPLSEVVCTPVANSSLLPCEQYQKPETKTRFGTGAVETFCRATHRTYPPLTPRATGSKAEKGSGLKEVHLVVFGPFRVRWQATTCSVLFHLTITPVCWLFSLTPS